MNLPQILMKKLLLIAVLTGLVRITSAGTTNVYVEDWGTTNGGSSVTGNGNINTVGWTAVAPSQTSGPYIGIYQDGGASDGASGKSLPQNTVYFTGFQAGQTQGGIIYTTDTSLAGSGGDSSFVDINPTLYTNLTLTIETRGATTDTNYFAVQVGGSWYVCTSYQMTSYNGGPPYTVFTNASLIYTNPANVWQSLTIGTTSVTIGAAASPSLTSPITGIGIVELPTGGGFNYNELSVTALGAGTVSATPPTIGQVAVSPQNLFAGGGASFAIAASGTQPLTYIWESNGVPLPSGDRYLGLDTSTLTITNVNDNDASISYSVIVTNIAGAATNSGLSLNVSDVPAGLLYAELFPYVGPTGSGNLPLGGVGWQIAAGGGTSVGIYQAGGGNGDVFSYSFAGAITNLYYATDTNDTGFSGLPFVDINPDNYPAVTFQAGFVPGNPGGQVPGAINVYWAVQMSGSWYCTAQAIPITLTALSPYNTNEFQFSPAATNWNNLTVTATGAVIGSQVTSDLTGNITGAGLVVAHVGTNADMNFQNFEITTNAFVGSPPNIGSDVPLAVTVASGGGASFGVAATGTPPFTYAWTTNGVLALNGGRVSGASTATITIADLTTNDNNMQIIAWVTNNVGVTNSATIYGPTPLTVTNPSVGLIYSEAFPFVSPLGGLSPLSSVGWTEAVPNQPNALSQVTAQTSQGFASASLGSAGTTVYYATHVSDTNQSGLPFPNVNLASYYPSLSFSVDIAPTFSSSNVTAYIAVQVGTNWFVSASPLPVPTASDSSTYATYTMAFDPTAANWKQISVTSSGGLIGAAATSNLSGTMTGAGLVFVTVGSGGKFNFENFVISGAGLGGINTSPLANGTINLSWVGNPAVELQSTTNLTSIWQDMPGTYGLYSLSVSNTVPQQFFRLKSP